MKKTLSLVALMLICSICFISCGNRNNNSSGNNEGTSHVYSTLNALIQKDYSKVNISTTVVIDDITLVSEYDVTDNSIYYSVEKMNYLSDNIYEMPEDYKTTVSGSATISNGQVIKNNEDSVTLPSYAELNGKFDFKESNFTNVNNKQGSFSANVNNLSNLIGQNVVAFNANITVEYNDSAITTLVLTYQTSASKVTTVYSFN